ALVGLGGRGAGLSCSPVLYRTVAKAFAKSRDVAGTERWILEMSDRGLEPGLEGYSTILRACGAEGQLQRLHCRTGEDAIHDSNILARLTFSSVLVGLADGGRGQEAASWLGPIPERFVREESSICLCVRCNGGADLAERLRISILGVCQRISDGCKSEEEKRTKDSLLMQMTLPMPFEPVDELRQQLNMISLEEERVIARFPSCYGDSPSESATDHLGSGWVGALRCEASCSTVLFGFGEASDSLVLPKLIAIETRRADPVWRAVFAVTFRDIRDRFLCEGLAENHERRSEPCGRCGQLTHALCESCNDIEHSPWAICANCDRLHLICRLCEQHGRTWWASRAENAARFGGYIVMGAFVTPSGGVVRIGQASPADKRPLRSSSPPPADGAVGVLRAPTMMSQMFLERKEEDEVKMGQMFLKLKEEDHEAKRRKLDKKYESQEQLSTGSAPSTPTLADTATAADCLTPSPMFCSTMDDIYEFATTCTAARKVLKWMGVKSVLDLACMFSSESDLRMKLKKCNEPEDIVCNVIRAWKLACTNEEHLIDEASTRLETGLATSNLRPEPASIASIKKSSKGLYGPPDRHSRLSVTTVLPPSKVAVKEFDKRDTHLEFVWNLYVELGDKGLRLSQAVREDAGADKTGFMRNFREFDEGQLRNKLSVLMRWQKWYESKYTSEQPYWLPSANAVSAFLAYVSQGGPTASSGVFQGLLWWASYVGIPFHLTDPSVCSNKAKKPGHSEEPVPPIDIMMFDRLLSLALALQGSVSIFAAAVLLLLSAGIRFEHIQRSTKLRVQDGCLAGTCARGKRRDAGVRPLFEWGIAFNAPAYVLVQVHGDLPVFAAGVPDPRKGEPLVRQLIFEALLAHLGGYLYDGAGTSSSAGQLGGSAAQLCSQQRRLQRAPQSATDEGAEIQPGYDDVTREMRNHRWRPDEVQTVAPADKAAAEDTVSAAASSDNDEPSTGDEEEPTLTAATILLLAQSNKAPMHLVQKVVEYRALMPWCRDSVFKVPHLTRGTGLSKGAGQICVACLARAPLSISRALKDMD
ncbi:unnamed protein product, partial [Polarella glacialis]